MIWDGFRPSSNPSFSVGIYPFELRLGDRTGNMLKFTGQCNNLHTLLYLVSLLHILLYLKPTFWKQTEFKVLRASLGTSYVAYAPALLTESEKTFSGNTLKSIKSARKSHLGYRVLRNPLLKLANFCPNSHTVRLTEQQSSDLGRISAKFKPFVLRGNLSV